MYHLHMRQIFACAKNCLLYVASISEWRVRKPPTDNIPRPQLITFKKNFKVLLQCFRKAMEQHWDKLSQHNFRDLRHVFAH